MDSFKSFIVESTSEEPSFYPVQILFESKRKEVTFSTLLDNTDRERLRKAESEVRTRPPVVREYSDGSYLLEFNFKSFPSAEMKRHKGFIEHKDGKILRLFCSCKDFRFRLFHPLVEAGLAKYELPTKYLTDETSIPKEFRVPPVKTNPDNTLFLCKHLAAMKSYL